MNKTVIKWIVIVIAFVVAMKLLGSIGPWIVLIVGGILVWKNWEKILAWIKKKTSSGEGTSEDGFDKV